MPAIKHRFPRLHRHLAERFRASHAFGLHLTLGVAILLLASWCFGAIADQVVDGASITLHDQALASYFHQHKDGSWTPWLLLITHWHSTIGVLIMFSLFAFWLRREKAWYWMLALLLAVPGGMILNVLLKYAYQRARPQFDEPLLTLATYSFPSGHTMSATVLYGMLAAWLVCRTPRRLAQALIAAGALAMILLVGFSRVYLGAHFLSDVLAAFAEGAAWLAVCISAVSTLRRRRAGVRPD
jgi:membrane-associated phospholipid phosphatase